MTTEQHAIGSGFRYRTTAAEAVEGIALAGRLAMVTGGYSGLGLETVKALAGAGAHVIVPARRRAQAEQMLAGGAGGAIAERDASAPATRPRPAGARPGGAARAGRADARRRGRRRDRRTRPVRPRQRACVRRALP